MTPLPRCFAGILLLWAGPVAAATLSVAVDREDIRMGESVTLTFASGKYIFDEPDFSPLEKDFEILSTQRSQTFHIINRQQRQENKWIVTVLPKKSGLLVIPPIAFGSDVTPARAIEVKKESAPSAIDKDKVFIQTEVEPMDPYVQENVLYTVRLFRAVTSYNSTLGEPKADDGQLDVSQLDSSDYKTHINGIEYLVNQKRYILVPLQSGAVTIGGVEFRGQLQRRDMVLDWQSMMLRGAGADARFIVRRSDPVTLNVRTVPAGFPAGAHWLPAGNVTVSGHWASGTGETEVGQPMTWLIRLQAVGLLGKQVDLPDLAVPSGFRSYHENPERQNAKINGRVTAVYERRTALIPEVAGQYAMPALAVPWWNTETDSLQYARLPETPMRVAPARAPAIAAGTSPAAPAAEPAAPASPSAPEPPPAFPAGSSPGLTHYPVLALAFLILWLMTMTAWWRERRRRLSGQAETRREQEHRRDSLTAIRRDLRDACRQGDARTARKSLLAWGRLTWPMEPPAYLDELVRRRPALRAPVTDLNHCLYRPSPSPWRGEVLWQAFERDYKNSVPRTPPANDLEPLHRIGP